MGLSQAKLAERVDTSTNYIAQIEQQGRFPSSEMLERIAAALEFDSSELFSTMGPFLPEELIQFQEGLKADMEDRLEKLMRGK